MISPCRRAIESAPPETAQTTPASGGMSPRAALWSRWWKRRGCTGGHCNDDGEILSKSPARNPCGTRAIARMTGEPFPADS